ncbi:MAG: DeoR/GlpR transcriptional regulator [Anaerolineales bacterium]|nr:DeoR/GlpR transcriptional regulator [Anaerolineales bacterium]
METMYREERLRQILQILRTQKTVHVKDLAERFSRSTSSIRLDLTELEQRGLVIRTHGGAILAEGVEEGLVWDKQLLQQRLLQNEKAKQRIGKSAADLIQDGDSVLIDGGSTTYFAARALSRKSDLTIITTSVLLFPVLNSNPENRIILTGGMFHSEYMDLVGDISMDSIRRFSPDHTIIGVDGISLTSGLTSTEPSIAPLKREMIARSKDLIITADSSKFGKICLTHVADVSPEMTLLTDTALSEEILDTFLQNGLNLLMV